MDHYNCISSEEALALIESGAKVVDIRDPASFNAGHIPDSFNLSNDNLQDYIAAADMEIPLIVCCYHGISSQNAAQFLAHQGFEHVSSLNGGFEGWAASHADKIER
jgi:thiosulfate sulfurtransferase